MAIPSRMKSQINEQLEKYQQKLRIIEYTAQFISLSNGCIISGAERKKFSARFRATTSIWIEKFDAIMNGEISETEIKHLLAVQRGKKCQALHGEKIKLNLNTGIPWMKGKFGLFVGHKHTEETKKKISQKNSGKRNGMFGRVHSDEHKKQLSVKMKSLILTGQFTPNSNNRNTYWDATFDGKQYRSSWEAMYQYYNQNAEYETLRIPYLWNGDNHVYIVDFVDHISKLAIEVKPKELFKGDKWAAKYDALVEWAIAQNYTVLLVDQHWLSSQSSSPDLDRFDNKTAHKIGKLYETGKSNRN
jgi:hypothetical protein